MKKYPNLFKPLSIKNMLLKNRVVMPPIGTNFAGLHGQMKEEHIAYYAQRARGGAGLIILENICVDYPYGTNGTTQLRIDNDQYLPGLFRFAEVMRSYGAATCVQLNHAGASASQLRMEEQVVSSSNVPSKTGGAVPRPLAKHELFRIAGKYGETADRARRAGLDSVEIHAGHSYLLSQFLSPVYNKRSDEFGGSKQNRARFPRMVIDEVRAAVGPNFPISLRISADELISGGNSLEDSLELLEFLVDGVDILNVSAALNDNLYYQIDRMNLEDGWRSYMAARIKEKFGKITMTTGNIRDPKVAEKILREGQADLVGMGRGLIAEPSWVEKVAGGQEHLLRKCISCNIGCADHRIGRARPIRCTVNPDLFAEDAYRRVKLERPPKLLVLGGGVAGLEAACTAAEMGCRTVLLEKSGQVGGLAARIAAIPEKRRIEDFVVYLRHRAAELSNLEIRLNTEADPATVRAEAPDLIVAATGSGPLLPPIDGLKEELARPAGRVHNIFNFLDDLEKFNNPNERVVVVGGGAVGLDVVEHFVKLGTKDLTVVEMMDGLGRDVDYINKLALKEMLSGPEAPKVMTSTTLRQVRPDRFIVEKDGQTLELPFDQGFVCLGMAAHRPLEAELLEYGLEANIKVISIGDRRRARRIIDGVQEGRDIQNAIIGLSESTARRQALQSAKAEAAA